MATKHSAFDMLHTIGVSHQQKACCTPPAGMQYGELLPNATGNYCQDVKVKRGQRYKLSFQYGRLMTYAKGWASTRLRAAA